MSKIKYELNEKIHAIIFNHYLTWENFNSNCDLIKKYNIKNISTSLNFLSDLKNAMGDKKINIKVLISYPFADLPIHLIDEHVAYAKDKGANEIEYVPNFRNLSKKKLNIFGSELEKVKNSGLPLTIIINKSKLDEELFNQVIGTSLELGITNFQFGDGFGPPVTSLDVIQIFKLLGSGKFTKVVGGIKKISQVIDFLDCGIDCVGTANFNEIFEEVKVF